MTQLNQLLAISKGAKRESADAFTKAYQKLGKADMFSGLVRTYEPLSDDGERFPAESKKVILKGSVIINEVQRNLKRLLDVACQIDVTNASARADVVVDDQTILRDIPATHLIMLEKQLDDLSTFVSKLPVLDPAHDWHWDDTNDCWRTEDIKTSRQQKVPQVLVKYAATDKHPAQTDVYMADVLAGYWTTAKLSGALPQARITQLQGRISKLSAAVKSAREKANMTVVPESVESSPIIDFLFA